MRLWDVIRGQQVLVLFGHEDGVLSVAFSPDGTKLASASADRTIRLLLVPQRLSLDPTGLNELITTATRLPRQLTVEEEEDFGLAKAAAEAVVGLEDGGAESYNKSNGRLDASPPASLDAAYARVEPKLPLKLTRTSQAHHP